MISRSMEKFRADKDKQEWTEQQQNPAMSLLPFTLNNSLRMHRECRERFLRHRELAIPTCTTARTWRMCRDTCRDR